MSQTHPIEHVVVLMMENHSFDNMLGWVPGVGELTGEEFNAIDPSDPYSKRIYVSKNALYTTTPDPAHDLADNNFQIFGTRDPNHQSKAENAWFVQDFLQQNPPGSADAFMACYTPEQLPALTTLAQEFTTLTRWFASVPGPTGPNRLFAHCATSGGYAGDQYEPEPEEPGGGAIPKNLNTIFQNLLDEGKSWRIYWEDFSTAMTQKQLLQYPENFTHGLEHFFNDTKSGELPTYTFLTPSLLPHKDKPANSQHPSYDIRPGDELIADVYEAIRNQPELWENTLLLITYDENGGFYDSIPAKEPAINPDGKIYQTPPGFDFKRLGVRVPAVVISAYTNPGVSNTVFDHTSIPATLKELFGLPHYLSKRDASANTLLPFCQRNVARTDAPKKLKRPTGFVSQKTGLPAPDLAIQHIAHFKDMVATHRDANHPLLGEQALLDHEAGALLRKLTCALLGKPY